MGSRSARPELRLSPGSNKRPATTKREVSCIRHAGNGVGNGEVVGKWGRLLKLEWIPETSAMELGVAILPAFAAFQPLVPNVLNPVKLFAPDKSRALATAAPLSAHAHGIPPDALS